MSLRSRLVASIAAVLLISVALGGALVCWRATNSVHVEMQAALTSAEDVVRQALTRQGERYTRVALTNLVMSFNGQRHIRAAVFYTPHDLMAESRLAPHGGLVPAWFNAVIGVRSQTVRIPLGPSAAAGGHGFLVLQTDPENELGEVWGQACDTVVIMLVFCGGTFILIFTILGRSLRFFTRFRVALEEISNARYGTSISEDGPPEFSSLARGFNQMAQHLRAHQLKIEELHNEILTLQEEERTEVARDLHDEVGPYLFAINVDADAIPRLVQQNAASEILERARMIHEAVTHIQTHVRSILRQLKPAHALDFGLQAAITDFVGFWKRRNPEIRFTVSVALDDITLDPGIEDAIFRIVREGVSNAVRHGRPGAISVAVVRRPPSAISIIVSDDGDGLHPRGPFNGMGLIGMAERARAFGGSFDISPGDKNRGTTIMAILPTASRTRLPAGSPA